VAVGADRQRQDVTTLLPWMRSMLGVWAVAVWALPDGAVDVPTAGDELAAWPTGTPGILCIRLPAS
jgi:hypothetical protein